MIDRFKDLFLKILQPIVSLLLRLGVSPDAVTLVGTLGVCAGALIWFPRGEFVVGVLVVTAFVFSDMVDGAMARQSGRVSKFGAFWDSTLDRVGDAAVFGGLVLYYAGADFQGPAVLGIEDNRWYVALALYCLASGSVTSYARARAEGLGMLANVGIAERSDRLVWILVLTGVCDLVHRLTDNRDWLIVIPIALAVLAVASTITVVQRVLYVRKQALAG